MWVHHALSSSVRGGRMDPVSDDLLCPTQALGTSTNKRVGYLIATIALALLFWPRMAERTPR